MEDILKKLKDFGCTNLQDTLERFLNDKDFYNEVLLMMLADDGFYKLKKQLLQKNKAEAFNTAHTLKGIITNCGITPMSVDIIYIVEKLRVGIIDNLMPYCDDLISKKEELTSLLKG